MGCNNSKTVKVQNTNNIQPKKQLKSCPTEYDLIFASTESDPSIADHNNMYKSVVDQVTAIKCPPTMVPILCMTNEATPIIVTSNDESDIKVPIVAMSHHIDGRVFCFANIQMITQPLLESECTFRFFKNLIKFILKNENYMAPVLLLDISPRYEADIIKLFMGKVSIDKGSFKNKFDRYRIIVMTHNATTSLETNESLFNFVVNGGTLLIFYDPQIWLSNEDIEQHDDSLNDIINNLLIDFNLAYYVTSQVLRCSALKTVPVPPQYSDIRYCTFEKLANHYKEILHEPNLTAEKLDETVTKLRYYIISCNESFGAILGALFEISMEYLKNSNYRNGNELFNEITQTIIAVVIQDIYAKIPSNMIKSNPDVDLFPGGVENITLSEISVHLLLNCDSIISTGLWCPPGHVVHVSCKTKLSLIGTSIQVGSHQNQLYMLPGPWHRWPSVVTMFPLIEEEPENEEGNNNPNALKSIDIDIYSPFGGMIYIVTNENFVSGLETVVNDNNDGDQESDPNFNANAKAILDASLNASLTFTNVCKYPRVVKGNPIILSQTKDIPIDWAEAESTCIILTLPSRLIINNDDVVGVLNKLDTIILKLNKYMSYNMIRPYRVVFDVDTIPDPQPSYPINMSIEDAEKIVNFSSTKVTNSLFTLIKEIAYLSLRDQAFDEETENALSALVSIIVLSSVYPKFTYKDLDNIEMPFLFKEFWKLHKQNPSLFSEILKESQMEDEPKFTNDFNDEKWTKFVQDLCRIGKWNYVSFFQDVRPVSQSFVEAS
ncbi:M60 family peptidase N-terminal accessory domain-containing protein [Helicobacter ganmani]|uniref:Peptidase M60 domain-containing protein n=1 Tax=Tritrichomonas musculus TaxID=1915356 RepID=A0ABR2JSK5_9EUKA